MTGLGFAAALGLVATLPVAVAWWAGGAAVERLTRAPRLREGVWTVGLAVSLLTVAATVAAYAVDAAQPASAPASSGGVQVLAAAWGAASAEPETGPRLDPGLLAGAVLAAAAGGLAYRLVRLALARRRLAWIVRRAAPLRSPILSARLDAEAARLRVRPPALLVSEDADRPLLVGVFSPAILVPEPLARSASPDRLALICAHELAHLARRDNLRLVAEEAAAGLLWFNPAFAAVRWRLRAAREEVCDASALAGAPPAARRLYADTLIDTLRPGVGPEPRTAFTGAARSTAMRLQAILNPAGPAPARTLAGAAGLCALLASVAAAGSVAAAQAAQAARDVAPVQAPEPTPDRPNAAYSTIAGPDIVIFVDGERQPDGFDLTSIPTRQAAYAPVGGKLVIVARTTGPDTFVPLTPEEVRMAGLPLDLNGPGVGAGIGPEGMSLDNPAGLEVDIAINGQVQPAGFRLESLDPALVRAFRVDSRPGGGARVNVSTRVGPSPRIDPRPQVVPAAPAREAAPPRSAQSNRQPAPAAQARALAERVAARPATDARGEVRSAQAEEGAVSRAPQSARAPRKGFTCPPPGFCVTAQQVKVTPGAHGLATYTGSPALYGFTAAPGQLLIDGQPQPAGLDLSTLDSANIERVEVSQRTPDGRPETANTDPATVKATVNVITKRR